MSPSSNLPEDPTLAADDSMLTRRLGKEVINYYAGSRLNRYSFLRSDTSFLKAAISSPVTRFLALETLQPVVVVDDTRLALFTFDEVKVLIGNAQFVGGDEDSKLYDSTNRRPRRRPLLVFLGLLVTGSGDQVVDIPTEKHGVVRGQPYFALDITPPEGPDAAVAEDFLKQAEAKGSVVKTNVRRMTLNPEHAAMFAQARSIMDWNSRNAFCAGCGQPNISAEAGYKRVCPPTDLKGGTSPQALPDCPTRHGVSNVCFPRTDPTMIAAVVSADGQRILLGRQSRWPPKTYSALAGFLEPGESIEDAVRREVWEESGVKVGRVTIHSSQPWPFPSSLMIGAIAQALPDGEAIELNDKELEDAKWFTFEEVREALGSSSRGFDEALPEFTGSLRLPPPQAIANRLVTAVVDGFLSVAPKI